MLRQAKEKGMCAENYEALLACSDRLTAIALYQKTIDWPLENDYPTIDTLREFFGDCEECGLYVSRELDITAGKHQVYVFHDCCGTVNVEMDCGRGIVPMLYFANNCDIDVVCRQPNFRPIRVPLYVCDGCRVTPHPNINAGFRVYNIGKTETQPAPAVP